MTFVALAGAVVLISVVFTGVIRRIALRYAIVDAPIGGRKLHTQPTPLLGGLAIYAACTVSIVLYYLLSPDSWIAITDAHVHGKHLFGILLGGGILVLGGMLDDIYSLRPRYQILAPIFAAIVVISFGIGVDVITNPFGGVIRLDQWNILLFWWNDLPRFVTVWADLITFMWLMGMMYTTKLLDGLDGLVSGITVIGAVIISLVSIVFFVNMPTAVLSLIIAGAFAGFLIMNFHPAKIFLGEAGSTLAGYMLGVIAIISGAKFATLLLILGIPILDVAWVLARRVIVEKRSPFVGDRKHLHFRLLDAGFSHRSAVLALYFFSASFGIAGLFLQSAEKLMALGVVVALMVVCGFLLYRRQQSA
ncbi:undecaprenyl/decaprenyl-phosphate alpha-N-acetylglucosaminyl 1-phosphate transferase [Candidatus Uhrbacteria bacterium]|nr:undecaprenyl/decaprenyl-phosphate alpha-N-acetylglucosaminyl 1-phosphate transferase [Candidatus Uhrbacteria bacterium]